MIYRKEEIMNYCKGKNVLHLGFIQHHDLYEKKIAEHDWLHEKIAQVANRVVGVDYLKNDVDIIVNKYGYEAYFADVTNQENMLAIKDVLKEINIDVIVCGELIEHVDNPGLMLENIKMLMGDETKLIITTPNPWCSNRIRLMQSGHYEREWLNDEHVAWYSFQTLKQLLDRRGFQEVKYGYYDGENRPKCLSSIKRLIKKILPCQCWHYPQELSDGLFFVACRECVK